MPREKTTTVLRIALLFLSVPIASLSLHANDANDWSSYNYDVTGSRHNVAENRLSVSNVSNLQVKWLIAQRNLAGLNF